MAAISLPLRAAAARPLAMQAAEAREADAVLIARFADGDQGAARELSARLAPGLLAFARRQLHDLAEAEDVVQETLLRLWKAAPEWQAGRAQASKAALAKRSFWPGDTRLAQSASCFSWGFCSAASSPTCSRPTA